MGLLGNMRGWWRHYRVRVMWYCVVGMGLHHVHGVGSVDMMLDHWWVWCFELGNVRSDYFVLPFLCRRVRACQLKQNVLCTKELGTYMLQFS